MPEPLAAQLDELAALQADLRLWRARTPAIDDYEDLSTLAEESLETLADLEDRLRAYHQPPEHTEAQPRRSERF